MSYDVYLFVWHLSVLGNDCISLYGNPVHFPFKNCLVRFHFVEHTTKKHHVEMAAVMMQVVPSFYSVYSRKGVHICANT